MFLGIFGWLVKNWLVYDWVGEDNGGGISDFCERILGIERIVERVERCGEVM